MMSVSANSRILFAVVLRGLERWSLRLRLMPKIAGILGNPQFLNQPPNAP
jgi:hypothetical protein